MLTQGPTNGPTTQASSLRAAALRKNGKLIPCLTCSSDRLVNGIRSFADRPSCSGKHFHIAKAAFRPNAGQITYAKRMAQRQVYDSMKGRERALQKQKEEERQVRLPYVNRTISSPEKIPLSLSLLSVRADRVLSFIRSRTKR